jgi:hypothetical protein
VITLDSKCQLARLCFCRTGSVVDLRAAAVKQPKFCLMDLSSTPNVSTAKPLAWASQKGKGSSSRKAQLGQGDAKMTATSDVFQVSTSWGERNTALAVELTEVLGSRNPAASAPLCRPGPSSQRWSGPPQCVAALNIARTAVAKGVAKTGVLRIHDRCPKFLKSVRLTTHSLRRILNHILANLRGETHASCLSSFNDVRRRINARPGKPFGLLDGATRKARAAS